MNNLLLQVIKETKGYKELMKERNSHKNHIGVSNIDEDLKNIYALCQLNDENILFICENELTGQKITNKINELVSESAVFISSEPTHFYFADSHSREITEQRIKGLYEIIFNRGKIIVTPFENLFKKMISIQEYIKFYLNIEVGMTLEMGYLIDSLNNSGYERCDMVENRGQYSVRGGIIDLFNIIDDNPIRIEFFDDEIDSIREFDLISQKSIVKLQKVLISPGMEILFSKRDKEILIKELSDDLNKHIKASKQHREKNIEVILEAYTSGQISKSEGLIPYYKGEVSSLLHYFNQQSVYLLDDGDKFQDRYKSFFNQLKEDFQSLLEKGEILPNFFSRFYTFDEVKGFFHKITTIDFQTLHKKFNFINPDAIVDVNSKEAYLFYGKIPQFIDQLIQWMKEEYTVTILASDKARCSSINEMLLNYNLTTYISQSDQFLKNKINILEANVNKGFILHDEKHVVLSEKDIFHFKSKQKKITSKKGRKIESFTQLSIGDYIVHDTHGIGVYMGIEQITVEGIKKDYLHLKYAKGDKLYIPVDQMESVQTYIGFGDKQPKINKLGSIEWKKSKQTTKQSVKDMAQDLIDIYAKRSQVKGYAFSKDSHWIKEFDEKFPYQETSDQLQAIKEVKLDMESAMPMDRLICGDVGYGKTEVAIRAAFKCVMDSKQVAILVPTTILAQQHYNSFLQRFEDYPVRIEMISRFRSKKQQESIINDLKKNQVDIIIGTHRLLSNDVLYYDLGLLVIDEEQRFGVKHKEKIKELRTNVDVLTLSATPIPRTLHMSLIGARDMSILNEPPHNRTPVQTYIMEYNEILIRDAINKELSRNGQVYYVYNKVHDIDAVASRVSNMVPQGRIAVAHGQMTENRLENIMIDFMNYEYNILICTTIIESGLDISNANTIVIEEADHMGLSQLYQLRGRVGRSDRLSYAYITYKKDKILSEIAEKRLKAIKDFTEFGSGFKIAMRDLEIRGAGNILGSKQHGHLATVGYDMYCKLLEEAVKELKGEEVVESINTTIEVNVDGYIPDHYVQSEKQKYELYKKIIVIDNQEELFKLEEEIEDRYGDLPVSVQNLLYISYIKKLSSNLGINKIKGLDGGITFTFDNNYFLDHEVIKELIKNYPIQFTTDSIGETAIILKVFNKGHKMLLDIKGFLEQIKSTKKK
ncbi:transcription-repair coupling factor [Alkalibaculum sp. M08DMB]|uniref:Transcription-repair-coupling factor n=1 Tax=Alkalibaculum sporogenes TaxID=2655001 RepID=A0A6A7K773_9FIRM|nr:transcription-repair coupling factor [Alkalibaculum sporogenes]MPW24973.1 transcription-repair coupling factor [Alkalibaculum sporogenes]